MKDAPEELLRALAPALLAGRGSAWARLDRAGRVLCLGGALGSHGLGDLAPGDEAQSVVPYLDGLLPLTGRPLCLPRVAMADAGPFDVHLLPAGPGEADGPRDADDAGGAWLVVLDASGSVRRESELLQKGNELELLRAHLEGHAPPVDPTSAEVLRVLDVATFQRDAAGDLRALGRPPEWCAPWLVGDPPRLAVRPGGAGDEGGDGDAADEPEGLEFLDNFLLDARAFWARGTPGVLRSGPWTEVTGPGELSLEALALRDDRGRALLLVERLSEGLLERRAVLQEARETSLGLAALRRELEVKELLLHTLLHDVRSPLASILGGLSLVTARELPPERQRELLEGALRQARRQEELLGQLLEVFAREVGELDRVERGERAPDLVACATLALENARPAFEERGVQLALTRAADLPVRVPVVGDAQRLERIFWNLLHNALRHSPAGSRVELALEVDGGLARATVRDQGPGVPEELVPRLFEPFRQGAGARGSAGLGLYYCHVTARRWGGHLRHLRPESGGAAFQVELERTGP